LSNNLDNLLTDIYSSDGQSQGVKELANLINNLSNLLLKSISQLESRVLKLEQASRGGASPLAPATTPAPKPRAASPFKPAAPVKSTPPPPPPQKRAQPAAPRAQPAAATGTGPSSAAQAASMLGATLKPAPKKTPAASPAANGSGPSFLTVVSPNAKQASPSTVSTVGGPTSTPDAVAPVSAGGVTIDAAAPTPSAGGGIAGPRGGFKGELAEKLARRREKVQQQLEDDFDAPEEVEVEEEEGPSSELKTDLEDELRNAFSKLKG